MVVKNLDTHDIELSMLYNTRKSIVFKLLGVVIYFIIDKHICNKYLYLHKYHKLEMSHKGFENTLYDENSGFRFKKRIHSDSHLDVEEKVDIILPIQSFCDA